VPEQTSALDIRMARWIQSVFTYVQPSQSPQCTKLGKASAASNHFCAARCTIAELSEENAMMVVVVVMMISALQSGTLHSMDSYYTPRIYDCEWQKTTFVFVNALSCGRNKQPIEDLTKL